MNSAKRLYELFTIVKNNRTSETSNAVWIKAFELESEPLEQHEDIGMACFAAVREEIELLRSELRDKECPEDLYTNSLAQLKSSVSPSQISIPWNQLVDRIGLDSLMMLNWADWYLGQNEVDLSGEERAKLLESVEQMIAEMSAASLPTFSKQMILRHLDAIRRALQTYKAQGIEPLLKALNETTGAMTTQKSHVTADFEKSDSNGKGVFGKAINLLHKAADFAEKAQKVKKGVDATILLVHQFSQLWQQFPALPGITDSVPTI